MKKYYSYWEFENVGNGLTVWEADFDGDCHCFEVSNGGNLIGVIYPADVEGTQLCIEELNKGHDPISYHLEDGCGNSCTLDGWGDE